MHYWSHQVLELQFPPNKKKKKAALFFFRKKICPLVYRNLWIDCMPGLASLQLTIDTAFRSTLFVCLFGFLTSYSTIRLYRRLDGCQDFCLTILCAATQRQSGETMTSEPVGSGRLEWVSNQPGPHLPQSGAQ